MRSEYAKALREVFAERMADQLPQFQPHKGKSNYLFPGERAYFWPVTELLRIYIFLCPDARGHDSFDVEIGWSTMGRLPELGMRPNVLIPDRSEFSLPEAVTRLSYLKQDNERWIIEEVAESIDILIENNKAMSKEEVREKVLPLVADAFENLGTRGIPYLLDYITTTTGRQIGKSLT